VLSCLFSNILLTSRTFLCKNQSVVSIAHDTIILDIHEYSVCNVILLYQTLVGIQCSQTTFKAYKQFFKLQTQMSVHMYRATGLLLILCKY